MTLPVVVAPVAAILAKSGGITLDPIAKPLAAVLAFFYGLAPNFGIAIFLLTVAMMIVLTPLTIKQTRSMLVMQKLQPKMKKLQEEHKNDRQALNEAVMALYKEHNASPLGGCLPMLLPFPVFIALLRVLEGLSRMVGPAGHKISDPKYLSHGTRMYSDIVAAKGHLDAFGMDLAKSARTIGGTFGNKLPYFVLLLLMVGTQYYQQAQLTSRNPQASGQPGQQAMMKFIPIFFGFISINFPAGVVIYWTVSNMIRIAQQWAMYRFDPKVKALVAKDINEIEAKTREINSAKKAGRPRLREMLSNAASAAAAKNGDTKGPGGKGAAGPGNKPGSGNAKVARNQSGSGKSPSAGAKPGGGAGRGSGSKGGAAGGGSGGAKAGTAKGAPPRSNPAKPTGNRPASSSAAAKGGGGANGGPATRKAPAAGAGSGQTPSAGGGKQPTDGTKPKIAPDSDGADAIPGGDSGGAAAAGNGGTRKGRTGGSSSRSVSSRRRRKGGR